LHRILTRIAGLTQGQILTLIGRKRRAGTWIEPRSAEKDSLSHCGSAAYDSYNVLHLYPCLVLPGELLVSDHYL